MWCTSAHVCVCARFSRSRAQLGALERMVWTKLSENRSEFQQFVFLSPLLTDTFMLANKLFGVRRKIASFSVWHSGRTSKMWRLPYRNWWINPFARTPTHAHFGLLLTIHLSSLLLFGRATIYYIDRFLSWVTRYNHFFHNNHFYWNEEFNGDERQRELSIESGIQANRSKEKTKLIYLGSNITCTKWSQIWCGCCCYSMYGIQLKPILCVCVHMCVWS